MEMIHHPKRGRKVAVGDVTGLGELRGNGLAGDRASHGKPPCHSRERGNPDRHAAALMIVPRLFAADGEWRRTCDNGRGRVASWIPAFAGMTGAAFGPLSRSCGRGLG